MERCTVVLTFESSVNEILWCDHSNETSLAVLLHGTICFSIFHKMKFGIFLEFGYLVLLGAHGLILTQCPAKTKMRIKAMIVITTVETIRAR